jgi:acetyl esterase
VQRLLRDDVTALDAQAAALVTQLESFGDPPIEASTPEAVRALRRARLRPSTVDVYETRSVDADGVAARLYRPTADEGLGLVVYYHGGGWVLGDLDTHDNVARSLAAGSGQAVLSVDYRLAPEHPFPAPLEDAEAALRWAHANARALGCDPARLAIAGDSAGANLAAVLTQRRVAPVRFQVLVYPVTDARCETRSYREFCDGPLLTAAGMRWFIGHYLSGGQGSAGDPRVSPLLAEDDALGASPSTLVVTAETDVLRDEGESYATRLEALGVPTTLTRYAGVFHGFLSFSDLLDTGRVAVGEASAALAAALAS